MQCPKCRRQVASSEARPFCSRECRSADLGHWFDGRYRIEGETASTLEQGDSEYQLSAMGGGDTQDPQWD